MNFKSYLRGLGMGMVITTIILMATFAQNNREPTNAEIVSMARELGMVETSAFLASQNTVADEKETRPEKTEESSEAGTKTSPESGTDEPTEPSAEQHTDEPTEQASDAPVSGEQIIVEMNNFKQAYVAAELLESVGVVDDSEKFTEYLVENGYAGSLFNGTYTFTKGMPYEQVANILRRAE